MKLAPQQFNSKTMKHIFTLVLIALVPLTLFSQSTDVTKTLIKNANFDQVDDKGRPSFWGFFAAKNSGAKGSLVSEDGAAKIELTSAAKIHNVSLSSNYGKTVSSDVMDFSGKKVTFSVKAKSSTAGSTIRFRVKANHSGSITFHAVGRPQSLSTKYKTYSATYNVPQNNSELNVQLLFGANADTYFFDDFKVEVE